MRSASGWILDRSAFDRLLALLDPDRDVAGRRYETLRTGLVRLFEWRGCGASRELADRTLDRVCRRIEEGAGLSAESVVPYCRGVARNVLKEYFREQQRQQMAHQALPRPAPVDEPAATDDTARRLECLHRCLEGLSPEDRELVQEYYRSTKGQKIADRRELTRLLGVSPGALRIRIFRIRQKLEACVERRLRP